MNFVEQRKKDVAFTIAENPTEITIEREEYIPSGGGRKKVKSTVGPFRVRIFTQGGKQMAVKVVSGTAGTKHDDDTWAFLADSEADIRAGANVIDEFTIDGIRFRVTMAIPRYWQGQRTSIDGTLKVVS
jgi:hypothetical protein